MIQTKYGVVPKKYEFASIKSRMFCHGECESLIMYCVAIKYASVVGHIPFVSAHLGLSCHSHSHSHSHSQVGHVVDAVKADDRDDEMRPMLAFFFSCIIVGISRAICNYNIVIIKLSPNSWNVNEWFMAASCWFLLHIASAVIAEAQAICGVCRTSKIKFGGRNEAPFNCTYQKTILK